MVWATALTLLLAASNNLDRFGQKPWEIEWGSKTPGQVFTTSEGVFYYALEDVSREERAVAIWLRGDHRRARLVKYRSSLWRVTFYCDGTYAITASTTYTANGTGSSWDGYGRPQAIRPDSMYEAMQAELCRK